MGQPPVIVGPDGCGKNGTEGFDGGCLAVIFRSGDPGTFQPVRLRDRVGEGDGQRRCGEGIAFFIEHGFFFIVQLIEFGVFPAGDLILPVNRVHGAERLVAVAAAFHDGSVCLLVHHKAVERGEIGVGQICFDVERAVKDKSHGVPHVCSLAERQDEGAAGSDAPDGEHLTEVRFGGVDVKPPLCHVKDPGDAQRGIDEKATGFVPASFPLPGSEGGDEPGGPFQIEADPLHGIDSGAGHDGSVTACYRVCDPFHAEVVDREHSTVEALQRVFAGKFIFNPGGIPAQVRILFQIDPVRGACGKQKKRTEQQGV